MTYNNTFKVAVLPLDIAWTDVTENCHTIEAILPEIEPDIDLLVLPELFSTGFVPTLPQAIDLAEPNDDRDDHTLAFLRRLSAKHHIAIAGSYLKRSVDGRPLNRAFFIEPSGEYTYYDKHHLFGLSDERHTYLAGETAPPVIRYRGWNISMIVCYDLRFPVWCRNRQNSYDMLIVPANWPDVRKYAWTQLLIARAIENQAVVVGANRSGQDDYGTYENSSQIYDYCGQPIGKPGNNGLIYATINRDQLVKYRKHYPFAADADQFTLS